MVVLRTRFLGKRPVVQLSEERFESGLVQLYHQLQERRDGLVFGLGK